MARDVRINIGAKDNASAVLNRTQTTVQRLGNASRIAFRALQVGAVAASAAIVATGAAARKMVTDFAAAGDELHKMALRTGVSVEALSELKFAAEQSGSSIGGIEKGIRGMQRALLSADLGSKDIVDSFNMLGISLDQIKGKRPEDQFTILVDAIAKVPDESERAALAMRVFGRAGSELLPLMSEGARGVAELRSEVVALGGQMTTAQAQAAADYTDAMNRLKTSFTGLRNEIASGLVPTLTDATDAFTFFVQNSETILNGMIASVYQLNIAVVELLQTMHGFSPLKFVGGQEFLDITLDELRGRRDQAIADTIKGPLADGITGSIFAIGDAAGQAYADGLVSGAKRKGIDRKFINRDPNSPSQRAAPDLQATQGRLLTSGRGNDIEKLTAIAMRQAKAAEEAAEFFKQDDIKVTVKNQPDNTFQMSKVG